MSTTDPQYADHPFTIMFGMLGIPRLRDAIDLGQLVDLVSPDDLLAYTSVAMVKLSADQPPGAAELAEEMCLRLICVLSSTPSETPRLREDDQGRLFLTVDFETAEEVEITDEILRHWEWLFSLFDSAEVAQALVNAVPEPIAERARVAIASRSTDVRFEEIVAGINLTTPEAPDAG